MTPRHTAHLAAQLLDGAAVTRDPSLLGEPMVAIAVKTNGGVNRILPSTYLVGAGRDGVDHRSVSIHGVSVRRAGAVGVTAGAAVLVWAAAVGEVILALIAMFFMLSGASLAFIDHHLRRRWTMVSSWYDVLDVRDAAEHLGELLDRPGTPSRETQHRADMFIDALRRQDPGALSQAIEALPRQGGSPSLPGPEPSIEAEQPGHTAAALLAGHDRAVDAATVAHVQDDIGVLPVAEQEATSRAMNAIVDAYTTLDALPVDVASRPNNHGSTPTEDAVAAVDSAMELLDRARTATYDGDVDALAALRRYATQWDSTTNPLRLD